ncbi:MAG: hypothetical protein JNL74_00730, partial [Fibrobacteres bacterium]|nr:hypothetical protein [Fibrobacterota bacterium]
MRFKKAFLWLLVSSTFLSAQMTWLNNGQLKLGVNLSLGGAVTYLSELPADINMINSYDWGRQIQMSYYSDPIPYAPNGNQPKAEWAMLGWNPIQSGDCYGNRSTVLTYTNADSQIYVKCIPMHWPLNNVPGECTFEVWYKLNGKTITVRSRINNARPETTWFAAKEQEQPAIYTNGPWYKLVTYIGDAPFTNAPVTEVVKKDDGLGFPWRRFSSPEQWMALVNDNNHGLGVWSLGHVNMCGGFAGGDSRKGSGGATDVQTGYISPIGIDILDSKITYDYNYTIIIGDVNEIRQYAKTHAQYGEPFTWTFMSDRQHWTYTGSARDQGWPIYNQLDIRWTDSTATILSPKTFWNADSFSQLTISADFKSCTEPLKIRLYAFDSTDLKHWPQWGEGLRPPASHDIEYFLYPTGSGFKTYKLDLSYKTAYMNSFTRIEIKLPGTNGSISLSSIKLDKYVDSSKGVVNLSLIDSVISQNINTQATVRLLRAGTEVKQISCNNGVCKITADSGSNYIINVSAAGYSSKISIPLFLT